MQKNIIDTKKLEAVLKQAHSTAESDQSGANASYIPALAKVPSNLFGLTAVTADGTVLETGDSSYPFAIESISKVFFHGACHGSCRRSRNVKKGRRRPDRTSL